MATDSSRLQRDTAERQMEPVDWINFAADPTIFRRRSYLGPFGFEDLGWKKHQMGMRTEFSSAQS